MLSIKGIYKNGEIRSLEHISKQGRFDVIITFLEDVGKISMKKDNLKGLFSDLDENDFEDLLECYRKRGQDWFTGRRAEL